MSEAQFEVIKQFPNQTCSFHGMHDSTIAWQCPHPKPMPTRSGCSLIAGLIHSFIDSLTWQQWGSYRFAKNGFYIGLLVCLRRTFAKVLLTSLVFCSIYFLQKKKWTLTFRARRDHFINQIWLSCVGQRVWSRNCYKPFNRSVRTSKKPV